METTKHILIVDDEPQMLTTLDFILTGGGYKTSAADSARKALRIIKSNLSTDSPVDLLITDIQMPVITGIQLIDEIKALEIDMPTLAITGYGDQEMLMELKRRGVHDFMEKPFEPQELLLQVRGMLQSLNRCANDAKLSGNAR